MLLSPTESIALYFSFFNKSIPFRVRERDKYWCAEQGQMTGTFISYTNGEDYPSLQPPDQFPLYSLSPHPLAHMCCDLMLFLKDWLTSNGNNQSTFRWSAGAGLVKCPSTHTVPHQLIFKEMPKLVIIYMQSTCFCEHHYTLTYFLTSNSIQFLNDFPPDMKANKVIY